jgi:hypothetical protein
MDPVTIVTIAKGDRKAVAYSLIHLGQTVRFGENNTTQARGLYEESLAICRELGHRQGIADAITNLANLALDERDYALAGSLVRESLATYRELENVWAMAIGLNYAAGVASSFGDAERALRLAGACAARFEAIRLELPPDFQAQVERWLAPARKALTEEANVAAWAEGRSLTLEEAVSYALEEAGGSPPP